MVPANFTSVEKYENQFDGRDAESWNRIIFSSVIGSPVNIAYINVSVPVFSTFNIVVECGNRRRIRPRFRRCCDSYHIIDMNGANSLNLIHATHSESTSVFTHAISHRGTEIDGRQLFSTFSFHRLLRINSIFATQVQCLEDTYWTNFMRGATTTKINR